MILVIDTVNINGSHFWYNCESLNLLSHLDKKIIFYTKDPEFYSAINKNIEIRMYKGYLDINFLETFFFRNRATFFLAIDTRALFFGSFSSLIRNKVYAHSHSYLQTILDGFFKHKFSILLYMSCGAKFLVNSEGIKRRFNNKIFISNHRVFNIGHPLRRLVSTSYKTQKRLNIGFIGKIHHNKGISKFLELFDIFGDKYEFSINGVVLNKLDIRNYEEDPLSESAYINCLMRTDILFCYYPTVNYNLYPSGTLLDAVAFSIPIICSNKHFAADVFGLHVDKFIFDEQKLLDLFSNQENLLKLINQQRSILSCIRENLIFEFDNFQYDKLL